MKPGDTVTAGKLENMDHIARSARRLAKDHDVSYRASAKPYLLQRVDQLEAILQHVHNRFMQEAKNQKIVSGAAEWLLDNYYTVDRSIQQVRENLPAGYYQELSKLTSSHLSGYPRVYAVAREMLLSAGENLGAEGLKHFVRAYQEISPFTMGEIWALPTMLRLCTLELLIKAITQDESADLVMDETVLHGPPLPAEKAAKEVVAASIRNLLFLDTQDWSAFFEDVSLLDEILDSDPAGIYPGMDFDTRDRYRAVIEKVARAVEHTEEEVARKAVHLAKVRQEDSTRAGHVGFYLVGPGLELLEDTVSYHPGWGERLRRWIFDHAPLVYMGGVSLLTVLFLAALMGYTYASGGKLLQLIAVSLLGVVPASVVAVSLANTLITHTVPPRILPKMDFSEGIPGKYSTMVVVPSLLSDLEGIDFLLNQLELHYLRNQDPNLGFAILTDFSDAPEKSMPGDDVLLKKAREGITHLNQKYGRGAHDGPFSYFHRRRVWNPSEECWMGWERKRGKLVEFNTLLRGGGNTSYVVQMADLDFLSRVEYVITLDADTVLPKGVAAQLIGTLAHPLNRAAFDPAGERVIAGYTVLQPRTEVKPTAVNQTPFTRIYAGDAGLDLYTRAVSDVYQDFLGEGDYVGKGIYDVDAFQRSLEGRVPENALLSHDLFEGIHGRAALVSDVVLLEDYPPGYLSYAYRKHRWVRGDWQLIPWLFPEVPHAGEGKIPNKLSIIDRWKIFDNLRRSLRSPVLLFLLAAGWLWLPGSTLIWTLITLLISALPLVTGAMIEFTRWLRSDLISGGFPSFKVGLVRWLVNIVFLPYEALLMIDALGTSLARMAITRKRLLEWTTSAHTILLFGRKSKLALLWRRMGSASVLAVILGILLSIFQPDVLLVALPLLLAWGLSPRIAGWLSEPVTREKEPINDQQRRQLRRLARRTWLYFERYVGPEDNWLAPDHFQEEPRGVVANRTSPTNIGLMLVSTLAAYDLGYIGLMDLTLRIGDAFESLGKLERFRGHFLNWYDTQNLTPLSPRYVSTVDSGNLAGSLLALRQGIKELQHEPVLRWQQRWQGFSDTLDVLSEVVAGVDGGDELEHAVDSLRDHLAGIRKKVQAGREEPGRWLSLLVELNGEDAEKFNRLLKSFIESESDRFQAATLHDLRIWSERLHYHLRNMKNEWEMFSPWLSLFQNPPSILRETTVGELDPITYEAWQEVRDVLSPDLSIGKAFTAYQRGRAKVDTLKNHLRGELEKEGARNHPLVKEQIKEAIAWCDRLDEQLQSTQLTVRGVRVGLQNLASEAAGFFQDLDFSFLFDTQRKVFRLGYHVDGEELDDNHYDLLASEARMASFVAIAKGDVSQQHWLHLGRPFSRVDGSSVMLSWNGSMFEYLMPGLLMRNYEGMLLDQTYHVVVQHQIDYARRQGVPWGISESSYYRFDNQMNYQYRGFGLPRLGRKHGLGEDLVITPYASLLALQISPREVMKNISDLIREDALGHYGFYEAVDYTPTRLPLGEKHALVRSYMAHHQGMILLSLTNYLTRNCMIRRLHSDPRIESVELLLQERIPQRVRVEGLPREARVEPAEREPVHLQPWQAPADDMVPQAHFLSNGRYSVMITRAGGGYSSLTRGEKGEEESVALTRWRADTTLDNWGTWIYLQEPERGTLWSAGRQPVDHSPQKYDVLFHAHQVEFRLHDDDLGLNMTVTVAPDADVEIRRLTLTNHSRNTRSLRLTSYGEVALAPQTSDRRHPAFNKLFIESEYLPDLNALLFRRRPRSAQEQPTCLMHLLVPEEGVVGRVTYESDRAQFVGRGHTTRDPAALKSEKGLSETDGATLDPIMALGMEMELDPYSTSQLAFITLAASTREEAISLAHRYRTWSRINLAFSRARTQSENEMQRLNLEVKDLEHIQRLFSLLFYPHRMLRAAPETLSLNRKSQSGLWTFGVSGDYPILLVRMTGEEELSLVRKMLRAHAYWRARRVKVDLVILNEKDAGYAQELSDQINQLITKMESDAWINRRGGIFLLRSDQLGNDSKVLLETAARVVLDGGEGSLGDHLSDLPSSPSRLPKFIPTSLKEGGATHPLTRPDDLMFDNGFGGFSPDGREYITYLDNEQWTPAPWINVIANPSFGFLVTETGSGYTWAGNSGENRLTPWRNDPVSDQPGEALYLRDENSAEVWSPTPLPARGEEPYIIRHSAGYTTFEHNSHGIKQRMRLFAAADAPVKVVQLRLENTWEVNRRLTATYYVEWVLGAHRSETQQYIVPEYDAGASALLARNTYHPEYGERVAFLSASEPPHGLTADRMEFLGPEGSLQQPAALERIGLSGRVETGLDPCGALQIHIELDPGETKEVFFLLGQGADRAEALGLIDHYQNLEEIENAWCEVNERWDDILGAVTVKTPDLAMDLLLNRWLLYQSLSCRVWGRSALYQSSGAYGFRDQLQDVLSLVHAKPDLVREHILYAASHQFTEGDVLHWWHPPSGRGVRTRISDDLLWLPYVTAEYVKATGDEGILKEEVPFRTGEPLELGEQERYAHYASGDEKASLYEHCCRALDKGSTAGPHGLPLIGAGDWNDGLNRLGIEGRGESVWLGWFLYAALRRFSEVCDRIEDINQAQTFRQRAKGLLQALKKSAWDGEWYLRAYDDDGVPLGSSENSECRITSMAQSWAVLSGAGGKDRVQRALESLSKQLVREEERLIQLFRPPFDETTRDPGYIKGYPPGIRENGGQYTHAALWVVWAYTEMGQGDRAERYFRLLNPINHSDTWEKAKRYCVEPYVAAADVYSHEDHLGRGGWTWYTGSAGWMYRVGLEAILGLRREGKTLRIDPCVPPSWSEYEMTYRSEGTIFQIQVENPDGVSCRVQQVTMDGEIQPGSDIPLVNDGQVHRVQILMGKRGDQST